MNIRQIQEARELYGIEDWGSGYFGIDDQGYVVAYPTQDETLPVRLMDVIEECVEKGRNVPLLIRFPQIIGAQIEKMHDAFTKAIEESQYKGRHRGVFPFKVNQRHEFIENVVSYGHKAGYGLEIGTKSEFMAALGYELSEDAMFICNGFKDHDFVDMAFAATAMGKNTVLVIEGMDELQLVLDKIEKEPDSIKCCPDIGIRIRLYSKGSGKWEKSSGEASKFGLTTIELLQVLEKIKQARLEDKFKLLHFHIGSQITEIKRVKKAIKEASRVYAKVCKMGFNLSLLDIGGGVGVDYDGSRTSFQSSANYSLSEFANDVVYMIGEVCEHEGVAVPDIITESGRVIAAYHSVVVTNVRKVQGTENEEILSDIGIKLDGKNELKCLDELLYILDNISRKNYVEYYHDSIEHYEELFTLFSLGYASLKEKAIGEEIYHRICHKALFFSSYEEHQLEEFEDLQKLMVSKYLANFSMFQSIPDAWAIDQLFPVMPLSQHCFKPTLKASIVDITCDSDGCVDQFVDRRDVKQVLDLHAPSADEPYYLGFFLVGAYQESLASEHNIFGAINEVEVSMDEEGNWKIEKLTEGDSIEELLVVRNYDSEALVKAFQSQLQDSCSKNKISEEEKARYLDKLKGYLKTLPYLIG